MKQIRLNFLQKKLSVILIALFLTAVPGFISGMDLETQLGNLETKLVGLKGKLGHLKAVLKTLQSGLNGSGGLTVNSGLGVLPWVQVPDVEVLKNSIVAPHGKEMQIAGALKSIQSAITGLRNILSSSNSTIAEKTIITELNLIKTKKDSAQERLDLFNKNLEIYQVLDPISESLNAAKNPLSNLNNLQKLKLKDLESKFSDKEQYKQLTALLNDISDDSKRTNASNYIQNLRDILITANPNMEKNNLTLLNNTSLSELQQQALGKYYHSAQKLFDDKNFSTLKQYKKTFEAIMNISETLKKKIESGTTSNGIETIDTIKKKMIDTLKNTKLEIKTDKVEDLASLFTITPAQINDASDREKTVKAIFEGFIDSQSNKDKGLHKEYLAKAIVRLNLDIFIQFKNFNKKTRKTQNKAIFNEKFNSKLATSNVDWYDYFKEKVDNVVASINPEAKTTKLKTVYSWVKEQRKNKKTQTSHVGLSEEELEKRAGFLRGLINTFVATNIVNDAKTLNDNMAGINKLNADEKTNLKNKILTSTKKEDFDKIRNSVNRGNLSTIFKNLGFTNEEITDRGLALPAEKQSGPKKPVAASNGNPADTGKNSDTDSATALANLHAVINSKKPAAGGPPPPPPLPGAPVDVSGYTELTSTDIDTIIANRNGIPKSFPILKALVTRQKDAFTAKGKDGEDVLKKLGIAH